MNTIPNLENILSNLAIESLNEMQKEANQLIQNENDVLILSPTGSGKTLAYLLPIFAMLESEEKGIQCLILSPTRELALQIEQVWKKMATGFKVNTFYGGHSTKVEIQNLSEIPSLLIGTPGRIAEHINKQNIDLSNTKYLVLDEYDKSLTFGFEEDMSYIFKHLKNLKKHILASATAQERLPAFANIKNLKTLDNISKEKKINEGLELRSVFSESAFKANTVYQLLCHLDNEQTLIFCNLRESAEELAYYLSQKDLDVAYFHGKLEQIDREKTLISFRNGSKTYLIATDLAARGLDIPSVRNIIHYEIPYHYEDFVHRNGRTARMNASGTAYILMSPDRIPSYLDKMPKEFKLNQELKKPKTSEWDTLYISGGKKDKISKMDIVGFFLKVGQLDKEDIGLIEIKDFMSFAAIKKSKVKALLSLIKDAKMKGKKYKIQLDK